MEALVLIAGLVLALGYLIWRLRRMARKEVEHEQFRDTQERLEKGRDRVRDGRNLDPDERVRRNDGRW